MRAAVFVFALLFCLLLLPLFTIVIAPAFSDEERADAPAYPPGQSIQQIEERKVVLVVPAALDLEKPASLVVVLHGAGGTATGMAGSFAPWAAENYVVCAPKALGQTWKPDDIRRVLKIAAHLKSVLPIDPKKVHVVGFSNGGWELSPLAFDDDLRPCSATWIAAGYRGGQVPKWAKTDLGAIALAGRQDGNYDAARGTVRALHEKVRNVEFHVQENLGHAFPRELMPYLQWWMGTQEGRLVPGDDRYFDWQVDLAAAQASQAEVKKGGVFLWLYAADDAEREETRTLQLEIFFNPEVRFLARQIACVKLDAAEHAGLLDQHKVKSTPALVVFDRKGKVKKVLQARDLKTKRVRKSLRGIAPKRTMPKE